MRAVSARNRQHNGNKGVFLLRQRIVTPSVGCSSHPGRAAPFWGTIQKNAELVGPRLCLLAICSAVPARAAESLEQTIAFLFHRIETTDATFIRNGQAHTPQEAVRHVRDKYEHFKGQTKTPEDFIRLAATKSLLTGQPYLVRTRDGKEMPLNTRLSNALREHRENEAK